jgi:hypothetical protein
LAHKGCQPLRIVLLGKRLKRRGRNCLAANTALLQPFDQFQAKRAAQTLRGIKHRLHLPTGLHRTADMRQPLDQEQPALFAGLLLAQRTRLFNEGIGWAGNHFRHFSTFRDS